jgi:hypothetical protein
MRTVAPLKKVEEEENKKKERKKERKKESRNILTVRDVTHSVLSISISVINFVSGGVVYSTSRF